ncbi:MAG: carboxypeptidase regulatory-like domain-containing protein [Myxococcota bacterium]|jgi:hypothetical protein|nr:carboxypeptidase regulatory-like domain-containing protein [Myxococcota bacterium]
MMRHISTKLGRLADLAASMAVVLLIATPAAAYTGGAVSNGGSIKGKITVSGKQDETKEVVKDKSFCGGSVPAEKFIVSGDGGLKNVIVRIDAIDSGKPIDKEGNFTVSNVKCRFDPHVMVAPKGATMKVRNDDPVLHNSHFYLVQADSSKKNVINLALPRQGVEIGKKKILRKPGLLSVKCDAHDFMQAWIWVAENPYAEVTDASGSFNMSDVPAGSHTLTIWHEELGEKTVDVTVEAGKAANVDFSF